MRYTSTHGPAPRCLLTPHWESPKIPCSRKPFASEDKPKQNSKRSTKGPSSPASITSKTRHTRPIPRARHTRSSRRRRRPRPSRRPRPIEISRPSRIWRYNATHSPNRRRIRRSTNRCSARSSKRRVQVSWDSRGIDTRVLSRDARHGCDFLRCDVIRVRDIRLGAIFEREGAIGLRVIRLRRVGEHLYWGNGVHDQGVCY